MALLESISIQINTQMPDFTLSDPFGKSFTASQIKGKKGLLVVFTCNHCPYAQAVWPRVIRLSRYVKEAGIGIAAVNPNINPSYPEDASEKMADKIKEWQIPFPYLVDETQETARLYQAQCTPDIYLLNSKMELFYHGRIDDNWKDESKVTHHELKNAIDALVSEQNSPASQYPSMGCSIKWME